LLFLNRKKKKQNHTKERMSTNQGENDSNIE
jgi:hypothetical protein